MKQQIIKIRKRNGRLAKFDQERITTAIYQAVTAVSEEDGKLSQKLSNQVVKLLSRRFKDNVLTVEDVQNVVEEVLIRADLTEIAKAYIIYREQRRKLRETIKVNDESLGMVDQYLKEVDWEVKENANMTYSLQGLNNYISNGVTKRYWFEKVYPLEIRKAAEGGDFHIHDLGILAPYCMGWSLDDILRKGFTGVSGKISSKPAKHLRVALGQLVNFFYTLQGEAAGAIAVSSFDTFLAPFIRYDKLTYSQIKQAMQEFMFNCNVPTRVGFQCMSEDTEVLTKNGWKNYRQVKKGSIIATFNIEKGFIEYLPVNNIFVKKYKGIMYNLKNRISDQLISPEHRVVRKRFYAENYVLEKIEKILDLKSPFIVPVGSMGNVFGDDKLKEDIVKIVAWVITEGTMDKSGPGNGRISIYQSKEKNPENYEEIVFLCRNLSLKYTERIQKGLGADCNVIRFDANSTRKILKYFNSNKNKGIKFIPDSILNSDVETSRLFLETYIKGDRHEGCKITTTEEEIKDGLLQVIVNAGYGVTVLVRKPDNDLSKKDRYIIRLIKHKDTYINQVKKVNYQGIIWCPNTKNETVIARRNGKVFITGNTPFTNITLDLNPSKNLIELPVIIGGKVQKEKYGDFQKEMDLFNKAFYEVIMEGDATQRVFTFPIPTINITKDFDWDNPNYKSMWEATAKYGINYFSNFINSELDPEDIRSMCPISGTEKVLIKSSRGRQLEYSSIGHIYEGNVRNKKSKAIYETYSDGKFIEGKFNKFSSQKMIKVILSNGHEIEMTTEHLNYVIESNNSKVIKILKGKELKKEMYLPYSLKIYQGEGGNRELGYFIGAYAGDGSLDGETTVVFSLENEKKKSVIIELQKIAEKYFGAHYSTKTYKKTKLFTLKIHSRAAVGLCKDFVAEKERNKHYRARLFDTSIEFRKGVVAGHYATDGGNRNRIYTSSKKMVETLNMLAATLGTTTSIYKDSRLGRLSKEPNYAVLFYQLNRSKYGDFWFKYDNKLWVKIDSIKPITKTTAYCFEVKNGEPMFTVGTTGILTHNCRLRLNNKDLHHRGGGLFGSAPLTGSIGVVTINLPRIGYLAKTKEEFFDKLEDLMDLAKESLEIKRKTLESLMEKDLYPYSKFYLSDIKKLRGEYWANHFSTIGLIGMNEASLNFFKKDITSDEGQKFAQEVLDFMNQRLLNYQKETQNIYNLEATPAEGTSYRLAKKDKELYPQIITAGRDVPYYTNSTQLPVNYGEDMFSALALQDNCQTKYTGGCIEKGNKVLTNKGLLNIEYIVKNFNKLKPIKVLGYNIKKGISEWDSVVDAVFVDVKKKNKIKIKAERGLDIITSDWHPFFVLERIKVNSICPVCQQKVENIKGFASHLGRNPKCREEYLLMFKYQVLEKRADELKKGDYILQNFDNLYPEKSTALNNDLMWLIGFFIGDGCISKFIDNRGGHNLEKYRVRFHSENQRALQKIVRIISEHFHTEVKVIKNDKRSESLREVTISKKVVLDFFFKYGFNSGKKVYNISVPQKVRENFNKSNVFAFLSGLIDSDGHISKRDGDFEYQTVSDKLAEDILEISTRAGLMISKSLKASKRKNEVNIYRLRIPRYQMTRIKDKLNDSVNCSKIKTKLSDRKKRQLPVIRVTQISKVDMKDNQFYDLTTKKNHNYLAGKNTLVFIHNTVFHAFLGERIYNSESVKNLIEKVFNKFRLPYFTLTPTFSICPTHNYINGKHFTCPECGKKTEVYSRIVGYLRPIQQWNEGKQEEFKQRKEFVIKDK